MSHVPYKCRSLKSKNWCNYSYYFTIFSSIYIICITVTQQRTEFSNFLKKAVEQLEVHLLLRASDWNLISKLHLIQLFLYRIKCLIYTLCMLFTTSILFLHCTWIRKENKLTKGMLIIISKDALWTKVCKGLYITNTLFSYISTLYYMYIIFFSYRFFCYAASKWDSWG